MPYSAPPLAFLEPLTLQACIEKPSAHSIVISPSVHFSVEKTNAYYVLPNYCHQTQPALYGEHFNAYLASQDALEVMLVRE